LEAREGGNIAPLDGGLPSLPVSSRNDHCYRSGNHRCGRDGLSRGATEMNVLLDTTITLSSDSRTTAGLILLTVVAVESGGWLMLRVVRGQVAMTGFQRAFARAGHAHAGVLVTLALVCQILADGADLSGVLEFFARNGIWAAAILMPAGFFLSSVGREVTTPNRLIWLIYTGAVSLGVGAVSLGVGLLTT
jgi:hypothetical protein